MLKNNSILVAYKTPVARHTLCLYDYTLKSKKLFHVLFFVFYDKR